MSFVCRRSFLSRKRFFKRSFQVRNPAPPRMISSMIVTLTVTLAAHEVREENCSSTPIRSNPALQNAETEWNTAYPAPRGRPNLPTKKGSRQRAPTVSMQKVPVTRNFINLITPPIWGAETASWMTILGTRPTCFPVKVTIATPAVTTPSPPIWIRIIMTILPNRVHFVAVS